MPVLTQTLPSDVAFSSAEALSQVGPWISIDLALATATTFQPVDRVHALIDTGADFNMVNREYAERLGALPHDYITSFSVHGERAEPSPV